MTKSKLSSNLSSSLKNIEREIDLDNVIYQLNNTLSSYLDIFNLYNSNLTQNNGDECAKRNFYHHQANLLTWSERNGSNLFVKTNNKGDWIERINGEDKYKFKLVNYDFANRGLLLHDNDRDIYVEINGDQARVGSNSDNLNKMYSGYWVGFELNPDLSSLINPTNDKIGNLILLNGFRPKNENENSSSFRNEIEEPSKLSETNAELENRQNPKKNLYWVASNKRNVFEHVSGLEWIEKIRGKVTYGFHQVDNDEKQGVLLFDDSRNLYVCLNDYEALSGGSTSQDLSHLYDGKWVDGLDENIFEDESVQDLGEKLSVYETQNEQVDNKDLIETLNELVDQGLMYYDSETNAFIEVILPTQESNTDASGEEKLVWEADNLSNKFENFLNTDDWIEKIDDKNSFEFKAIKFDDENGLVLFDQHRQVYVALLSHNSLYGTNLDNLRPLYLGKWRNNDYKDRLFRLFNKAEQKGNGHESVVEELKQEQSLNKNEPEDLVLYDPNTEIIVELNENNSDQHNLEEGGWPNQDQNDQELNIEPTGEEIKNDFLNLSWQADNNYNIFENESDERWIEKLGGEPTFEFKSIKLNDLNGLLLYDPIREVFVEINENESRYGKNQDDLRHLYHGAWLNLDATERLKEKYNKHQNDNQGAIPLIETVLEPIRTDDKLKWVADNNYNVFENVSTDLWVEKLDGEPTFEFKPIRLNDHNGILLFDPKRKVFIELNESDSYYGHDEDNLRPLYTGEWSIKNFNHILKSSYDDSNVSQGITPTEVITGSSQDQESTNLDIEKLAWQADNEYNLFENVSNNKWIEKLGGEPSFEFETVIADNQTKTVLLFDPNRKVFVELNEKDSKYGHAEDDLRNLYNGKWIENVKEPETSVSLDLENSKNQNIPNSYSNQPVLLDNFLDESPLKWAADNKINVFENVPNTDDWVEKLNDIDTYNFKAIKFEVNNGLLLFDPTRHVFVEINGNNLNYGTNMENFRPLYHGKWLNEDFNERLNKLSNEHNFVLNSFQSLKDEIGFPVEEEPAANIEKDLLTNLNDFSSNQLNDEKLDTLKWKADNNENLFENIQDNDWIERINGQEEFSFVPVGLNESNNGILLFDPNRQVYVELNEYGSNYGNSREMLRPLYNGKWLNEDFELRLNILKNRLNDSTRASEVPDLLTVSVNNEENNNLAPKLKWVANNDYNIFEKVLDDKWIESLDGVATFEFKEVKNNGEKSVLLFDAERDIHVELNENNSNYRINDDEPRPLYNGRWLVETNIEDSFDQKIEPQLNCTSTGISDPIKQEFSNVLFSSSHTEEEDKQENLKWIADNGYNVFESLSDGHNWIEKLDGENTFEFETVSLNKDQNGIVLFDKNRKVFVELNEYDSNYGETINESQLRPLYKGKWLNEDFVDKLKRFQNEDIINESLNDANSESNQVSEEKPQTEILQEIDPLINEFPDNEQNQISSNNLKWIADNEYNVFEQESDDKWVEKLAGEPIFKFKPVNLNNQDGIVLYDSERDIFIELNQHDSNYGEGSSENLRHLYTGKWSDQDYSKRLRVTSNGIRHDSSLEESDNLVWSADNGYNVFESLSDGHNWIEKLGGEPTFKFHLTGFNKNNGVVLYDDERNIYVELNEKDSNYGISEDNIKPLYTGKWLNQDFEKNLAKLNGKLLNGQLDTQSKNSTLKSDFDSLNDQTEIEHKNPNEDSSHEELTPSELEAKNLVEQDNLNLKWTTSDSTLTFERLSSCVWVEKQNDIELNKYSTVLYDADNGWLLFDSANNKFVQIGETEIRKGNCIQIMNKLYDGRWVSKTDFQKNILIERTDSLLPPTRLIYIDWKADQVKNYLEIMKKYIETYLI